ncbi:DUF4127 family protein [bacterium]|nr:DUF4127 family protein [bacterium]
MNIAFIPIDNRPVCYTLPEQITKLNDEVKFFIPPRKYLGGLSKISDTKAILEWLNGLEHIDSIIMCLDTIAYGGLIPSRRTNESLENIKSRIYELKNVLLNKKAKIYAFSSIMRISNNNINEEEKEYWNIWGKKIFEYSYNFHKDRKTDTDIPKEILDDYLKTRKRNFEINKIYLEWQKEGLFDTLVFSKDDCAEYGLNVMEAQELGELGGFVKTGADEIPMTLLARALNKSNPPKIAPIFLAPEYKHLISNYEDVSIEKSVLGQLELAGCKITEPAFADIILYVNNFAKHQGEIVMKIPTEPFSGNWEIPNKPYIIADVRYANGADNKFVEKLFEEGLDKNFLGYSAWNTSANTLGSLICGACVKYTNKDEFIKLQLTRFLDDWAYQANVRQMLAEPNEIQCKELIKPFEDKLFEIFNVKYNTKYSFPWNRLFEVEIELY